MSSTLKKDPQNGDIQGRLREMNAELLVSAVRQHEMTERAELAEMASAKLAAIVEFSDDAIISKDLDGIIASWNKGAEKLFGYTADEAIGQPGTLLIPEDYLDEEPELLDRVRRGQGVNHYETVRRRKDGTLVDISLTVSPIRNDDGVVVGASKVARDITEQKRVEKVLLESEEKYRALFDTMDEGFCVIEFFDGPHGPLSDYVHIEANRAYETNAGIKGIVGQKVRAMVPDEADGWVDIYRNVLLTGKPVRFERELVATGRHLELSAFRVEPAEKRQVAVLFQNITARKHVRRAEQNAVHLAEIRDSLNDVSGVDEIMQIVGREIGEYLGLSICAFVELNEANDEAAINHAWHREDAVDVVGVYRISEYLTDDFQKAGRAGEIFAIDDTAADPRADAAQYAALGIGAFLSVPIVEDGEWKFALVVYHSGPHVWEPDETELLRSLTYNIFTRLSRARAQAALIESENRLQIMANSIPQLAWMAEPDGFIFWYNNKWFQYTGTTAQQMEGWGWQSAHDPEILPSVLVEWRRSIETGEPFEMEFPLRRADGVFRWFLTRVHPLRNAEGNIVRWFGTNTDVDDLRQAKIALAVSRAELEMRVEQRTAELAELHADFEAENAALLIAEKDRVRLLGQIVTIQDEERRRIARDLHDELGQQITALRLKLEHAKAICGEENVCDMIDETQAIAHGLDGGVSFLAWELRPLALDENGLSAAIGIYVKEWSHFSKINAEFQTTGFGQVRLDTERETNLYRIVQESLNNIHKHAKATNVSVLLERKGHAVELIIEDNGKGFDTNRKSRKGRRLGLVGMRERSVLLGGKLDIESTPGIGTTIFVRVPVV